MPDRWLGVRSLEAAASPVDDELVLEVGLELPVTSKLPDKASFSESDKSLILKITKENSLPSRMFSVLVFEATSLGSPRQSSAALGRNMSFFASDEKTRDTPHYL